MLPFPLCICAIFHLAFAKKIFHEIPYALKVLRVHVMVKYVGDGIVWLCFYYNMTI